MYLCKRIKDYSYKRIHQPTIYLCKKNPLYMLYKVLIITPSHSLINFKVGKHTK
jgi:hypothetical protein